MTTRILSLVAVLGLCGPAAAADPPEAVYAKVHAAAVARNLDEMRLYAAEARRADLALPDVPKTYRLTGKATRKDGNALELRASGTADSVGLGYTQIFGVVDLVKEDGEWKVDRLSWSTERPGDYPDGYVVLEGPLPEPRREADAPHVSPTPSTPEPPQLLYQKRAADAKPADHSPRLERSPPACVIKPVMTDEDLRACGARVSE
ncbi:MAG TPA: hypothetical protein VE935_12485 [Burkholderiales bacterium]|jgi:hypothetical protein|nr:hypothetical protein [Burkholderiales bacterium]